SESYNRNHEKIKTAVEDQLGYPPSYVTIGDKSFGALSSEEQKNSFIWEVLHGGVSGRADNDIAAELANVNAFLPKRPETISPKRSELSRVLPLQPNSPMDSDPEVHEMTDNVEINTPVAHDNSLDPSMVKGLQDASHAVSSLGIPDLSDVPALKRPESMVIHKPSTVTISHDDNYFTIRTDFSDITQFRSDVYAKYDQFVVARQDSFGKLQSLMNALQSSWDAIVSAFNKDSFNSQDYLNRLRVQFSAMIQDLEGHDLPTWLSDMKESVERMLTGLLDGETTVDCFTDLQGDFEAFMDKFNGFVEASKGADQGFLDEYDYKNRCSEWFDGEIKDIEADYLQQTISFFHRYCEAHRSKVDDANVLFSNHFSDPAELVTELAKLEAFTDAETATLKEITRSIQRRYDETSTRFWQLLQHDWEGTPISGRVAAIKGHLSGLAEHRLERIRLMNALETPDLDEEVRLDLLDQIESKSLEETSANDFLFPNMTPFQDSLRKSAKDSLSILDQHVKDHINNALAMVAEAEVWYTEFSRGVEVFQGVFDAHAKSLIDIEDVQQEITAFSGFSKSYLDLVQYQQAAVGAANSRTEELGTLFYLNQSKDTTLKTDYAEKRDEMFELFQQRQNLERAVFGDDLDIYARLKESLDKESPDLSDLNMRQYLGNCDQLHLAALSQRAKQISFLQDLSGSDDAEIEAVSNFSNMLREAVFPEVSKKNPEINELHASYEAFMRDLGATDPPLDSSILSQALDTSLLLDSVMGYNVQVGAVERDARSLDSEIDVYMQKRAASFEGLDVTLSTKSQAYFEQQFLDLEALSREDLDFSQDGLPQELDSLLANAKKSIPGLSAGDVENMESLTALGLYTDGISRVSTLLGSQISLLQRLYNEKINPGDAPDQAPGDVDNFEYSDSLADSGSVDGRGGGSASGGDGSASGDGGSAAGLQTRRVDLFSGMHTQASDHKGLVAGLEAQKSDLDTGFENLTDVYDGLSPADGSVDVALLGSTPTVAAVDAFKQGKGAYEAKVSDFNSGVEKANERTALMSAKVAYFQAAQGPVLAFEKALIDQENALLAAEAELAEEMTALDQAKEDSQPLGVEDGDFSALSHYVDALAARATGLSKQFNQNKVSYQKALSRLDVVSKETNLGKLSSQDPLALGYSFSVIDTPKKPTPSNPAPLKIQVGDTEVASDKTVAKALVQATAAVNDVAKLDLGVAVDTSVLVRELGTLGECSNTVSDMKAADSELLGKVVPASEADASSSASTNSTRGKFKKAAKTVMNALRFSSLAAEDTHHGLVVAEDRVAKNFNELAVRVGPKIAAVTAFGQKVPDFVARLKEQENKLSEEKAELDKFDQDSSSQAKEALEAHVENLKLAVASNQKILKQNTDALNDALIDPSKPYESSLEFSAVDDVDIAVGLLELTDLPPVKEVSSPEGMFTSDDVNELVSGLQSAVEAFNKDAGAVSKQVALETDAVAAFNAALSGDLFAAASTLDSGAVSVSGLAERVSERSELQALHAEYESAAESLSQRKLFYTDNITKLQAFSVNLNLQKETISKWELVLAAAETQISDTGDSSEVISQVHVFKQNYKAVAAALEALNLKHEADVIQYKTAIGVLKGIMEGTDTSVSADKIQLEFVEVQEPSLDALSAFESPPVSSVEGLDKIEVREGRGDDTSPFTDILSIVSDFNAEVEGFAEMQAAAEQDVAQVQQINLKNPDSTNVASLVDMAAFAKSCHSFESKGDVSSATGLLKRRTVLAAVYKSSEALNDTIVIQQELVSQANKDIQKFDETETSLYEAYLTSVHTEIAGLETEKVGLEEQLSSEGLELSQKPQLKHRLTRLEIELDKKKSLIERIHIQLEARRELKVEKGKLKALEAELNNNTAQLSELLALSTKLSTTLDEGFEELTLPSPVTLSKLSGDALPNFTTIQKTFRTHFLEADVVKRTLGPKGMITGKDTATDGKTSPTYRNLGPNILTEKIGGKTVATLLDASLASMGVQGSLGQDSKSAIFERGFGAYKLALKAQMSDLRKTRLDVIGYSDVFDKETGKLQTTLALDPVVSYMVGNKTVPKKDREVFSSLLEPLIKAYNKTNTQEILVALNKVRTDIETSTIKNTRLNRFLTAIEQSLEVGLLPGARLVDIRGASVDPISDPFEIKIKPIGVTKTTFDSLEGAGTKISFVKIGLDTIRETILQTPEHPQLQEALDFLCDKVVVRGTQEAYDLMQPLYVQYLRDHKGPVSGPFAKKVKLAMMAALIKKEGASFSDIEKKTLEKELDSLSFYDQKGVQPLKTSLRGTPQKPDSTPIQSDLIKAVLSDVLLDKVNFGKINQDMDEIVFGEEPIKQVQSTHSGQKTYELKLGEAPLTVRRSEFGAKSAPTETTYTLCVSVGGESDHYYEFGLFQKPKARGKKTASLDTLIPLKASVDANQRELQDRIYGRSLPAHLRHVSPDGLRQFLNSEGTAFEISGKEQVFIDQVYGMIDGGYLADKRTLVIDALGTLVKTKLQTLGSGLNESKLLLAAQTALKSLGEDLPPIQEDLPSTQEVLLSTLRKQESKDFKLMGAIYTLALADMPTKDTEYDIFSLYEAASILRENWNPESMESFLYNPHLTRDYGLAMRNLENLRKLVDLNIALSEETKTTLGISGGVTTAILSNGIVTIKTKSTTDEYKLHLNSGLFIVNGESKDLLPLDILVSSEYRLLFANTSPNFQKGVEDRDLAFCVKDKEGQPVSDGIRLIQIKDGPIVAKKGSGVETQTLMTTDQVVIDNLPPFIKTQIESGQKFEFWVDFHGQITAINQSTGKRYGLNPTTKPTTKPTRDYTFKKGVASFLTPTPILCKNLKVDEAEIQIWQSPDKTAEIVFDNDAIKGFSLDSSGTLCFEGLLLESKLKEYQSVPVDTNLLQFGSNKAVITVANEAPVVFTVDGAGILTPDPKMDRRANLQLLAFYLQSGDFSRVFDQLDSVMMASDQGPFSRFELDLFQKIIGVGPVEDRALVSSLIAFRMMPKFFELNTQQDIDSIKDPCMNLNSTFKELIQRGRGSLSVIKKLKQQQVFDHQETFLALLPESYRDMDFELAKVSKKLQKGDFPELPALSNSRLKRFSDLAAELSCSLKDAIVGKDQDLEVNNLGQTLDSLSVYKTELDRECTSVENELVSQASFILGYEVSAEEAAATMIQENIMRSACSTTPQSELNKCRFLALRFLLYQTRLNQINTVESSTDDAQKRRGLEQERSFTSEISEVVTNFFKDIPAYRKIMVKLLGEYANGFMMRKDQNELLNALLKKDGKKKIGEAQTGAGKTAVLLFLQALYYADGTKLVDIKAPRAIMDVIGRELNNDKLMKGFQARVQNFSFDHTRSADNDYLDHLLKTVIDARSKGRILLMDPITGQSLRSQSVKLKHDGKPSVKIDALISELEENRFSLQDEIHILQDRMVSDLNSPQGNKQALDLDVINFNFNVFKVAYNMAVNKSSTYGLTFEENEGGNYGSCRVSDPTKFLNFKKDVVDALIKESGLAQGGLDSKEINDFLLSGDPNTIKTKLEGPDQKALLQKLAVYRSAIEQLQSTFSLKPGTDYGPRPSDGTLYAVPYEDKSPKKSEYSDVQITISRTFNMVMQEGLSQDPATKEAQLGCLLSYLDKLEVVDSRCFSELKMKITKAEQETGDKNRAQLRVLGEIYAQTRLLMDIENAIKTDLDSRLIFARSVCGSIEEYTKSFNASAALDVVKPENVRGLTATPQTHGDFRVMSLDTIESTTLDPDTMTQYEGEALKDSTIKTVSKGATASATDASILKELSTKIESADDDNCVNVIVDASGLIERLSNRDVAVHFLKKCPSKVKAVATFDKVMGSVVYFLEGQTLQCLPLSTFVKDKTDFDKNKILTFADKGRRTGFNTEKVQPDQKHREILLVDSDLSFTDYRQAYGRGRKDHSIEFMCLEGAFGGETKTSKVVHRFKENQIRQEVSMATASIPKQVMDDLKLDYLSRASETQNLEGLGFIMDELSRNLASFEDIPFYKTNEDYLTAEVAKIEAKLSKHELSLPSGVTSIQDLFEKYSTQKNIEIQAKCEELLGANSGLDSIYTGKKSFLECPYAGLDMAQETTTQAQAVAEAEAVAQSEDQRVVESVRVNQSESTRELFPSAKRKSIDIMTHAAQLLTEDEINDPSKIRAVDSADIVRDHHFVMPFFEGAMPGSFTSSTKIKFSQGFFDTCDRDSGNFETSSKLFLGVRYVIRTIPTTTSGPKTGLPEYMVITDAQASQILSNPSLSESWENVDLIDIHTQEFLIDSPKVALTSGLSVKQNAYNRIFAAFSESMPKLEDAAIKGKKDANINSIVDDLTPVISTLSSVDSTLEKRSKVKACLSQLKTSPNLSNFNDLKKALATLYEECFEDHDLDWLRLRALSRQMTSEEFSEFKKRPWYKYTIESRGKESKDLIGQQASRFKISAGVTPNTGTSPIVRCGDAEAKPCADGRALYLSVNGLFKQNEGAKVGTIDRQIRDFQWSNSTYFNKMFRDYIQWKNAESATKKEPKAAAKRPSPKKRGTRSVNDATSSGYQTQRDRFIDNDLIQTTDIPVKRRLEGFCDKTLMPFFNENFSFPQVGGKDTPPSLKDGVDLDAFKAAVDKMYKAFNAVNPGTTERGREASNVMEAQCDMLKSYAAKQIGKPTYGNGNKIGATGLEIETTTVIKRAKKVPKDYTVPYFPGGAMEAYLQGHPYDRDHLELETGTVRPMDAQMSGEDNVASYGGRTVSSLAARFEGGAG
ncbi:hypothetical protein DID77_03000, partial [Candidatus Marinamargulisbacteria bacterium SCGC AG-439-L15]